MKRSHLCFFALLLAVGIGLLGILWKEMDSQDDAVETRLPEVVSSKTKVADDSKMARPEPKARRRNPKLPASLLDELNSPDTPPENDVTIPDRSNTFRKVTHRCLWTMRFSIAGESLSSSM